MFNLTGSEKDDGEHECAHADFSAKKIKQGEDGVQELIDLFKIYRRIVCTSAELVSITTGDVASEVVTNYLLISEITGKKVVSELVENRLIKKTAGFHDRIMLKNLQTLRSCTLFKSKSGRK